MFENGKYIVDRWKLRDDSRALKNERIACERAAGSRQLENRMDPHAHAFLDSERRRTRVASSRKHRRRGTLYCLHCFALRASPIIHVASSILSAPTSLDFSQQTRNSTEFTIFFSMSAFFQEAAFVKRTRGRFCRTARRT